MKNIGILTGTRAEYGLLKPVMQKVEQDKDLNLCLIVTGMHLSDQFFLYGTPEYTQQQSHENNLTVHLLLFRNNGKTSFLRHLPFSQYQKF